MAVHVDLINSGELRQSDRGTVDLIEFMVTGVSTDPYRARLDAAEAAGVPRLGEPHPAIPALRVRAVTVSSVQGATSKRRVKVEYSEPDPGETTDRTQRYGPAEWRGAVRIITEQTRRDYRGKLMRVFYSGTPQFELISLNSGQTFIGSDRTGTVNGARLATADVDKPLLSLLASRWERDDPESKAIRFRSSVNADRWRGMEPRTVLLDGLLFDRDPDGGWRVEYAFTYNPAGWAVENAIVINGLTPIDITEGNGLAFHDVYEPVSFAALELDR